ncbi:MAG: SufB/SufD family protein [Salinispira sp.]
MKAVNGARGALKTAPGAEAARVAQTEQTEQTEQIHERLQEFRKSARARLDKTAWPTVREEEWRRSDVAVFDFDSLAYPDAELLAHTRAERKSKQFFSLNLGQSEEGAPLISAGLLDRVFRHLEHVRDTAANRLILWNLALAEDIFVLHISAPSRSSSAGAAGKGAAGKDRDSAGKEAARAERDVPEGDSTEIHELCWHSLGEDISRHAALIVLADEMSEGTVYLRLKGMEGHVQNFAAFYDLGPGAALNVSVIQESSEEVVGFYQAAARMERDSRLSHFEGILGGGFIKNRVEVELAGSGSELRLNGLYFADNDQHVDMRTVQRHAADHADSRTFYKGVIGDEAETIFQGLIEVSHEATGTDAYLTNNNLLVSDEAKSDSIPSLNINTNDVKCSHGSTSGKINEEQIYYFQCRGFSRDDAEQMLILGYFEELIDELPEKVQTNVRTRIQRRLQGSR